MVIPYQWVGHLQIKLLFLGVFLFPFSSLAGEGQILVLEAPVFAKPDYKSKVVMHFRKGDIVYIHNKYFTVNPYRDEVVEENLSLLDAELAAIRLEQEELDQKYNTPQFYATVDRLGNTVYVPRKFVKLIFQDRREERKHVTSVDPDPTDYRLNEPISDDYPFYGREKARVVFSVARSFNPKINYPYDRTFSQENFGIQYQGFLSYLWKVHFDEGERFWFGGFTFFSRHQNTFALNDPFNSRGSTETHYRLGLGPMAAYDTFRTQDFTYTLFGGISLIPLNSIRIVQTLDDGTEQLRDFSRFGLGPRVGMQITKRQAFAGVDLIASLHLQLEIPQTMESKDDRFEGINNLWRERERDFIERGTDLTLSFHIGFQGTRSQQN